MEDRKSILQEEFSLKSDIIDLLNDFGEMVIKDYSPLKITEEDFYVLFELIKEQFRYIKETIDSLDAKNNKETSLLELLTSNMRSIESNY